MLLSHYTHTHIRGPIILIIYDVTFVSDKNPTLDFHVVSDGNVIVADG
jgi:hypothetical protein